MAYMGLLEMSRYNAFVCVCGVCDFMRFIVGFIGVKKPALGGLIVGFRF
jgi:hypothetical protein